MKKISFIVVPLMTVSFLASCAGSTSQAITTHKFTFTGDCCKINDSYSFSHDIYEDDKYVQYTVVADNEYSLPETIEGDVAYSRTSKKVAIVTIIKIKSDIDISITANPDPTPAKTFTVSFDPNGGELTNDTVNPLVVESTKTIPLRDAPKLRDRPGYDKSKVKWFDKKTDKEFRFGEILGTPVTDNLVLKAVWESITTYTVHFKSMTDGAIVSEDQTIDYGSKVQRPATPTIPTGYTFDDWYNEDKQHKFEFDEPLTRGSNEFTIYAKFDIKECHITYITNGGTLGTKHIDKVDYGNTIDTAPDITREGYDGVTWWLDQDMTANQFIFGETLVEDNINLYAKWVENPKSYNVKWIDHDGSLLKEGKCEEDNIPVYEDDTHPTPTRPSDAYHDYSFYGWSPEPTNIYSDTTYLAIYHEEFFPSAQVCLKIKTTGDNQTFAFTEVNGENVLINYGDGSDSTTLLTHKYAKKGEYYIRILNYVSTFKVASSLVESARFGTGISSIGESAFSGCSNLTSIDIPSNITSIGNSAFNECKALNNVTLPNSIVSIGNKAFYRCLALTSINIPNSVTSIGDEAFFYCTNLASISIPDGVTSIGDSAFLYCTSLDFISIPSSVTSIGVNPFGSCSSISSITVDNGNPNYDSRDNCNAIIEKTTNALIAGCKNTIIPSSVTSIGDNAFLGCTDLTSINIPNGVTSIGDSAFYGCSSLANLSIPGSVNTIKDKAFVECYGLTDIFIPNSVTSLGEMVFYHSYSLKKVEFDSSSTLETIPSEAFENCNALSSINIPDSVTSIGKYAFQYCHQLTSITIPKNVSYIDSGAFSNCNDLIAVNLTQLNTPPDIVGNIFYNTPQSGTLKLYVTPDTIDAFKESWGYEDKFTTNPAPVLHTITANPSEHGTMEPFAPAFSVAGVRVSGGVIPDEGYHCVSVTSSDVTIHYTPGNKGFYFIMPDKDVTVTAVFEHD